MPREPKKKKVKVSLARLCKAGVKKKKNAEYVASEKLRTKLLMPNSSNFIFFEKLILSFPQCCGIHSLSYIGYSICVFYASFLENILKINRQYSQNK